MRAGHAPDRSHRARHAPSVASGRRLVPIRNRVIARNCFPAILQRRFEFTLRFAEVSRQLGQLRTTEQHQHEHENNDQLWRSYVHERRLQAGPGDFWSGSRDHFRRAK